MSLQLVYITTKDTSEARQIGKTLVTEHLAACVNILSPMVSIYSWEGKIEESDEAVLLVKTDENKLDELMVRVKALHSYEVPCILSIPLGKGNPEYIKWLSDSLRG